MGVRNGLKNSIFVAGRIPFARIVVVRDKEGQDVDEREHDHGADQGAQLGDDAEPREQPMVVGFVAEDPADGGLDVGETAADHDPR